ncbi:MAG TPA: peptidylprolyl isomerase [Stellaceae bacterium]|nr:peptidylprolyl isomerase [Stellaceae bacterium]
MIRIVAALLFLTLGGSAAWAQSAAIAAVVNDDVISTADLEARVRLVLLSSQLPDNPQVRQRVVPQVLRSLVDEKLEMQEAKRYNVAISEKDVAQAIERLEQQNRLAKGGLDKILQAQGIPRSTLVAQVTSSLAWNRLVEGRLAQNVTVSEEEINETIARIKEQIGRPQSRIGEIFLSVDKPDQEAEVKALADRLVEQIKAGASFNAVAQQFSQSPTAAVGGDLGWVSAGELPGEVGKVIETMQPGQLSPPIRGTGGFYLIYLADRRTLGASTPADAIITLARLAIPVTRTATDAEKQQAYAAAKKASETAKSCGELLKIGEQVGPQFSGELKNIKISSLPRELQPIIIPLKIAEASKPLILADGVGVLMVCERNDAPSPIPTRDQVRDNILRQRLETLARRYLSDLRRTANVDLRV